MRAKDGRPFEPGETPAPGWARPLLYAASLAFGAGARMRGAAYDAGLLATTRLPVPVISVGNITVGGSGKTPFTMLLVQALIARGHRPAVLSRGYGRRPGGPEPLVVSRGEGPCVAVEVSGDEPWLIAARTAAMVVVDADRIRAAQHAVQSLGATVLVLDDGFQKRALARDLDIVMLDAERPLGSGHSLPKGPLREGAEALGRADLLVLTQGASAASRGELPECAQALPTAVVQTHVLGVGPVAGPMGSVGSVQGLRGARVALMSGIARPHRFEASVLALGAEVVHREVFADHAWLSVPVLQDFLQNARAAGATRCLTTDKDAVRLPAEVAGAFEVLRIEHRFVSGRALLEARLDALEVGG